SSYSKGTVIPFTVHVQNVSSSRVTMTVDPYESDYVILDTIGDIVFQFSKANGNAEVGYSLALEPGQGIAISRPWPQTFTGGGAVPSGHYTFVAWMDAFKVNDALINVSTWPTELSTSPVPFSVL
ncbi:MAG TPA: BsuPI-related putative proteinase inhibitor, partial [Chthonomonadales bacterium]|nr:BsuPI-related putative proteinase inhibitor [Chthonomonadales bacterium]